MKPFTSFTSFTSWRGFDLTERVQKVERAFQREPVRSAEDVPILINTPAYFSFGSKDKPADYYTNPTSMLAYQADGYERHLRDVEDDLVPYFMPWLGTGVLASAFGCPVRVPDDPSDDPAVLEPCIRTPADAARLRLPDPETDGWMPRVLEMIDYAVAHGDLPVGLTDMQGPLDTLGLMCSQAQLYQWMYSEPAMIHDLFDLVTEAFIQWVKVQKEHIGEPLERSNGLQGVYSPGCGVWESDDDLVLIDPGLYGEFVAPRVGRIFNTFGGGSVHFCGSGVQNIEVLKSIENLKVINNSPLGNYPAFGKLRRELADRAIFQIQDGAPASPETYYPALFAEVDDFSGLMLATFVMDNVGMDQAGGYIPVDWQPFEAANRLARSVRQTIARRLVGEDTRPEPQGAPVFAAVAPAGDQAPAIRRSHSSPQEQALSTVRQALLDFDSPALQGAVGAALAEELSPLDIIQEGMAAAMDEVGKQFEAGECFLPQLLLAGNTMKAGMEVLQPLLKGQGGAASLSKGKIILGTVKGDLHDIGKNIVRTMLEGSQFEVIDLGVDVAPEKFIQAVREHHPQVVAMSALLTTTLPSMRVTVEALQAAGLRDQVRVIIGGAPISREYANQIGAEGYAATAVSAVDEVERLLKL